MFETAFDILATRLWLLLFTRVENPFEKRRNADQGRVVPDKKEACTVQQRRPRGVPCTPQAAHARGGWGAELALGPSWACALLAGAAGSCALVAGALRVARSPATRKRQECD